MNASHFTLTRRRFLTRLNAAALSLGVPAWFLERQTVWAADPSVTPKPDSDKLRFALIGCGGMGVGDAKNAQRFAHCLAVCDVDENHRNRAAKELSERQGNLAINQEKDFRKILERNDIDFIINATPDHWHTLINIGAMNAGKDVYSEKPLTLTIDEGKQLRKTWHTTQRILQTGSQQRSDTHFRLACELALNGRIGKVHLIRSVIPAGLREGPFETAPVPKNLDWDFWQGQAPAADYVPERCHGTFRQWYEYSGGAITDWGAHHNDIALWGSGHELGGPISAEGIRKMEPIYGGYNVIPHFEVHYTFKDGLKLHCLSTLRHDPFGRIVESASRDEPPIGVTFEGEDGKWIFVTRGSIKASHQELLTQALPENKLALPVSHDHFGNFIEGVRTRKQPICHTEIGHRSATLCHLGAISLRLGRKIQWDPEHERIEHDAEANGYVSRPMRAPYDLSMVQAS